MKRLVDIIGSLCGLIFILLLFPFIAFAIFVESGGPILIKLDRVSDGRTIKVYKFRSMIRGAHKMKSNLSHLNERKDGPLFKIKNDPRLTKVGKFLRKFRLDEFPQFINVLKGDMALVGPRPLPDYHVKNYNDFQKRAISIKPGLT